MANLILKSIIVILLGFVIASAFPGLKAVTQFALSNTNCQLGSKLIQNPTNEWTHFMLDSSLLIVESPYNVYDIWLGPQSRLMVCIP